MTAPEPVPAKYRGLRTPALVKALAASRPAGRVDTPDAAAPLALRTLARTHQETTAKAEDLEDQMHQVLAEHYPALLAVYGVGTIVAAQLSVTAGGNPHRIRNEAAFASLCGAAPFTSPSAHWIRPLAPEGPFPGRGPFSSAAGDSPGGSRACLPPARAGWPGPGRLLQ